MDKPCLIHPSELALVPLSELTNLAPWMHNIVAQFVVDQPHGLLLYLIKNTPTEDQLKSLLSLKQPKEVLQLVYSEELVRYHLDNVSLPNAVQVIKLAPYRLEGSIVNKLIEAYFGSQSGDSQADRELSRRILELMRFWIEQRVMEVKVVVESFQDFYFGGPQLDIEKTLKMVEFLLSYHHYSLGGRLESSSRFRQDVLRGLTNYKNPCCNLLGPKVYLEMAKLHHDFSKQTETFIDIYCTLNSFGVHLIKDLWPQFAILTNSRVKLNFIPVATLMAILLRKVAEHNNQNIPKNCIRDLLTAQNIDMQTLFQLHQTVVYDVLVPVLNSGQFYADSLLHEDSKFSSYVWKFFCKAYNEMESARLQEHLRLLLVSISVSITYDQAVPAFLAVFEHIDRPVGFIGVPEVQIIVSFLDKVYKSVHMRKRWQIVNAVVRCLEEFLSPGLLLKQACPVVLAIPEQAFGWNFIHDRADPGQVHLHTLRLKSRLQLVLKRFPDDQLRQHMVTLCQESVAHQSVIDALYRLLSLLPCPTYPDLEGLIDQVLVSSYVKQEEQYILVRHLSYQVSRSLVIRLGANRILSAVKNIILQGYDVAYDKSIGQVVNKVAAIVLQSDSQNDKQALDRFAEWLVESVCKSCDTHYLLLLYTLLLQVMKQHYRTDKETAPVPNWVLGFSERANQIMLPKDRRYLSAQLRLEVNLALLFNRSPIYKFSKTAEFTEDPLQLVERYDYECLPEVCEFLTVLYLPNAILGHQFQQLDRVQKALLNSLLRNLEYSVVKQDVISYVQFTLNRTTATHRSLLELGYVERWVLQILKTGSHYIYFHRVLANTLYQLVIENYETLVREKLLPCYVGIMFQLAQVQEYRGFDAQVAFQQQELSMGVLEFRSSFPEKAEYFGMYPRLLVMRLLCQRVVKSEAVYDGVQIQFLKSLGQRILEFSIEDQTTNRMMFSPAFRAKLRLWQFMQVLIPFYQNRAMADYAPVLYQYFQKQLQQPNQPQIKHYVEIFITRIMVCYPRVFTPLLVGKLTECASLSQSISGVIMAGQVLKSEFNMALFNRLLPMICHNTSYLRGLTQYFCFHKFEQLQGHSLENTAVHKLYSQFKANSDSAKLTEKVRLLMLRYQHQISCLGLKHLLTLEVFKAGEFVQEYIQDVLKKVGFDLVKEIKESDEGYIPIKDLWKREAQILVQKETAHNPEGAGFQKKIDPLVEGVYSPEYRISSANRLRILASNLQNPHNIGHLIRTGQIFGLEQLAIKDCKVLETERLKSVSCTGQKWLNIVQVAPERMLDYIEASISGGYQVWLVDDQESTPELRSTLMPEKLLLVEPSQQKGYCSWMQGIAVKRVKVGKQLSVHVQAAIIMWQNSGNGVRMSKCEQTRD